MSKTNVRAIGIINRLKSALIISVVGSACFATTAGAVSSPYPNLSITSTIANSYSYSIGGGPAVTVDPSPNNVSLRVGSDTGGYLSEVGLDLTSFLDGDSFLYLHNGYCVGTCSVSINTTLSFSLTNTGPDPLSVRWDSLITPGHLAQVGSDGTALFQLIVVDGNEQANQVGFPFQARGETFGWYDLISLDTPFSGYTSDTYSEGPGHLNARYFTNWSATPINLDLLSIPAGTTTSLNYYSRVQMSNTANCLDLSTCTGVQVAFGDPRNSGEIKGFAAFADFMTFATPPSPEPYIGRAFDVYTAPTAFVTPDTPLPPPPPVLPPVSYTTAFTSQIAAVPEPSSWAMMILGFGVMGAAMRRRTAGVPLATA